MNPDWLLKHFDQISEAPDAVPRLRRFILDLAVRGKLVPQDSQDEPAMELLKQIERRTANLSTAGGDFKKPEVFGQVSKGELPFDLCEGWSVARMGLLARKLGAGSTPLGGKSIYQSGGIPFLRSQNVHNDGLKLDDIARIPEVIHERMSGTHLKENDILLNITGASIGRCALLPSDFGEGNVSQHVAIIRLILPEIRKFVHLLLISPAYQRLIMDVQVGVSREGLSMQRLKLFPVILPPLAEQHRIVAKVDELMALCDELEAAQSKREKRRDRLVSATLHGLKNGRDGSPILGSRVMFHGRRPFKQAGDFNETALSGFRDAARFFLNNIPRLTTRLEHIQRFRKTILNLAVCGELVPQDPHDEPASDLLRKINIERQELVRSGRIKQREVAKSMTIVAFGRQIPAKWEWVELQEVFHFITDGDHQPPPRAQKGIPFLVIGNIRNRRIELNADMRYVPQEYYLGLDEAKVPRKGKILYTLVGSYGIPILLTNEFEFCVQRHIAILTPSKCADAEYLAWMLESQLVFTQATHCATGIAQKTVPLSGLRRIRVPLPPVSEQQRVVEKLDELMGLCDQLEARLASTTSARSQLLDSALSEALNGHSKPGTILMETA